MMELIPVMSTVSVTINEAPTGFATSSLSEMAINIDSRNLILTLDQVAWSDLGNQNHFTVKGGMTYIYKWV